MITNDIFPERKDSGLCRDDESSIKQYALSLGFSAVEFTPAELPAGIQSNLNAFISASHHGEMQWMEDRAALRGSPNTLWPEAKSAIVLGHNYAPAHNPLDNLKDTHTGNISVYARNKDYHDVIKKRLKTLARCIVEQYGCEVKVFVDTAPLMEKPLAAQAGLGWQGKHTCLVSREFGSWLFLGVILTTLELPSSLSEEVLESRKDHCGSCTKCLDICPTQAFTAARQIDARRCISYLTIEHKGHIPDEFLDVIGNRIYGCDDCLAICPWNKFAITSHEVAYHARTELEAPSLAMLAQLDDAAFRSLFSGSPIKRIGRDRFIRNVLIAIGNTRDSSYLEIILSLMNDASPLVRAMAVRALKRCDGQMFNSSSSIKNGEADPAVLAQWCSAPYDTVAPKVEQSYDPHSTV